MASDLIVEDQKLMGDTQQYRRVRLLVKKLNRERKKQAKKIDILCNDLIAAQREFINRLNAISFAAHFYESMIGITDLGKLLYTASKLIKDELPDANVTFFLRQADSFELHMFESSKPITFEKNRLENRFGAELVENICRSKKVCTLDDMFAMGLEYSLIELSKVSAVTIPLGELGQSLGFILIYRSSDNQLAAHELTRVCVITRGLSRAIQAYQVLLRSAD